MNSNNVEEIVKQMSDMNKRLDNIEQCLIKLSDMKQALNKYDDVKKRIHQFWVLHDQTLVDISENKENDKNYRYMIAIVEYVFNAGFSPTLERVNSNNIFSNNYKIVIKVDGCVYENFKFKPK
ncbi:MAG: hypothetical protein Terrestrivirus1_68 [Terrestrivirus sp.]|uniref:Uncharacterized protein n=1 Tax=Terrestrivirus sp. TaxID=2487775 RepID=A0A3G4ZLB2_9VIRU|nr:MAG: hypothetical protein Terrestrivirus1_68 [Terrestrivirus sp.]